MRNRKLGNLTQRLNKIAVALSIGCLRIRPNSMQSRPNKSLASRPDGTAELSDTYAAAYLAATGYRVLAVELGRDGRWVFIFAAGDGLSAGYMDFLNNAAIGVQNYISGLFALKRLMRGAESEGASR